MNVKTSLFVFGTKLREEAKKQSSRVAKRGYTEKNKTKSLKNTYSCKPCGVRVFLCLSLSHIKQVSYFRFVFLFRIELVTKEIKLYYNSFTN